MLIKPGEHAHMAQLLHFMELGEQLARDCALQQCALAPTRGMKTFLTGQARQEGYHAIAFQGAIRWLAPKTSYSSSLTDQMKHYRKLVEGAIDRGDFAETLLAEQIILEGLGEAILRKIEAGLVKRGAPFKRLRRILIHQEEAHHQFGLRALSTMLESNEESHDTLRNRTHEYLPLAKRLLFSAQEAFYAIDEDPQEYWDDFYHHLPQWLHANSAQPHPFSSASLSSI